MDENELRLDYWIDTRSHPQFPLWVVFREIGHDAGLHDGLPYLRRSREDVASVLKRLEALPEFAGMASALGIHPQELRAAIWYLIWRVENTEAPPEWSEWNGRLDTAWAEGILKD